jgi:hypothetical protein
MIALDIDAIKRDASGRLDVAQKSEELQALVDKVYPGYVVRIARDDDKVEVRERSRNGAPTEQDKEAFRALSGVDQIKAVIKGNGGPVDLRELHTRLVRNGGSMSLGTMMSLLSRYRTRGEVVRVRRGLWALPDQKLLQTPDLV